MSYQQEKFTQIADAIREKTGTEDLIKPSDFAGKISEVYEKGEKSQYDEFWEAYQNTTIKKGVGQYMYSFAGYGWNDNTFKPKYDIRMRYGNQYTFAYSKITDLIRLLENARVILDTSEATSFPYMFYGSTVTKIPAIDCRNTTSLGNVFTDCKSLECLSLIVDENNTFPISTFRQCEKLSDITIEGTIGQSISFPDCPLSVKSVMSVLKHLIDCSGSGTVLTLTLSDYSKGLMEAQGEIAELGGKRYDEYITDKGWDLE